VPAVLTCVVGSRIGADGDGGTGRALRRRAAHVTVRICDAFPQYRTLRSRVLLTLLQGMADDRPLGTQYGSLAGVVALGALAVAANVLPRAVAYWNYLAKIPTGEDGTCSVERGEDVMECQRALLEAIGMVLHDAGGDNDETPPGTKKTELFCAGDSKLMEDIADNFGEKLIPFYSSASYELGTCFI